MIKKKQITIRFILRDGCFPPIWGMMNELANPSNPQPKSDEPIRILNTLRACAATLPQFNLHGFDSERIASLFEGKSSIDAETLFLDLRIVCDAYQKATFERDLGIYLAHSQRTFPAPYNGLAEYVEGEFGLKYDRARQICRYIRVWVDLASAGMADKLPPKRAAEKMAVLETPELVEFYRGILNTAGPCELTSRKIAKSLLQYQKGTPRSGDTEAHEEELASSTSSSAIEPSTPSEQPREGGGHIGHIGILQRLTKQACASLQSHPAEKQINIVRAALRRDAWQNKANREKQPTIEEMIGLVVELAEGQPAILSEFIRILVKHTDLCVRAYASSSSRKSRETDLRATDKKGETL